MDLKNVSKELLFRLRSDYYEMVWDCIKGNRNLDGEYCADMIRIVESEILDRNLWNEYLEYIRK